MMKCHLNASSFMPGALMRLRNSEKHVPTLNRAIEAGVEILRSNLINTCI